MLFENCFSLKPAASKGRLDDPKGEMAPREGTTRGMVKHGSLLKWAMLVFPNPTRKQGNAETVRSKHTGWRLNHKRLSRVPFYWDGDKGIFRMTRLQGIPERNAGHFIDYLSLACIRPWACMGIPENFFIENWRSLYQGKTWNECSSRFQLQT